MLTQRNSQDRERCAIKSALNAAHWLQCMTQFYLDLMNISNEFLLASVIIVRLTFFLVSKCRNQIDQTKSCHRLCK